MLMLLAAGLELQSQLTAQFSRAQTGHILAFCVSHRTVYYFWSRSGSGVLCVFAGNSVSKLSLATTPSSPTFSSHLSVYQTCLAFSNNTPKTEKMKLGHILSLWRALHPLLQQPFGEASKALPNRGFTKELVGSKCFFQLINADLRAGGLRFFVKSLSVNDLKPLSLKSLQRHGPNRFFL
jgi:hypothetical protein